AEPYSRPTKEGRTELRLGSPQVGPRDQDVERPAPDDDAPVHRRIGCRRDLVMKGAVGRLQWSEVQARRLGPGPAGLAREIDVDVRRVGYGDVLEANQALPGHVDDPHRPLAVVDRI